MLSSKDSAREMLGLDKVNLVDHVAIQVASPEIIRSWSKGEVKTPRRSITAPSSLRKGACSANEFLVLLRIGNVPAESTNALNIVALFAIDAGLR